MVGPALMWNDDSVDSAQMCSEIHVRNHGISLFIHLDEWGASW